MTLPGMVVVFIIILLVFYVSGYPIPPILTSTFCASSRPVVQTRLIVQSPRRERGRSYPALARVGGSASW
jgi:hypothetical protein